MANSADPDQFASSEATDLDLHCWQSRVYQGSAGQGLKANNFEEESLICLNFKLYETLCMPYFDRTCRGCFSAIKVK